MFIPSHAGGKNSREWAKNFPKNLCLFTRKYNFERHNIISSWKKNEAFKKFKPENMHMAAQHTWKERHKSVIKLKAKLQ